MSAAIAFRSLQAPREARHCPATHVRLVEPERDPDAHYLAEFRPKVGELLAFAKAYRLRAAWFTFTTSAVGTNAEVMGELKRRWESFRHKAVWRRVLGFLVVFGDHGRPHAHILAVLPPNMPIRAVRAAWSGGHTWAETATTDHAERIAAYCAKQYAQIRRRFLLGRRSFAFRAPEAKHLALRAQGVREGASQRADAGGDAAFGETKAEGSQAVPSCRFDGGERPQAVGSAGAPAAAVELNQASPPCRSEPFLRLVRSPITTQEEDRQGSKPTAAAAPSPAAPTIPSLTERSATDVEIGIIAARSFVPRRRDAALCIPSMAAHANLMSNIVEEAIKQLFFLGHVRRRGSGRSFVYWATSSLPPAIPVLIPERLRLFMAPSWKAPA